MNSTIGLATVLLLTLSGVAGPGLFPHPQPVFADTGLTLLSETPGNMLALTGISSLPKPGKASLVGTTDVTALTSQHSKESSELIQIPLTSSSPADTVLASSLATSAATVGTSSSSVASPIGFEGLNQIESCPCTPPDVQVATGPNHIVEMVNFEGRTFQKNGTITTTFTLSGFFGTGSAFISDPKILFDASSRRWFASIIDCRGPSVSDCFSTSVTQRVVIAVSTTDSPTAWKLYEVLTAPGVLPDQPIIGVSDDKFVVSANDFGTASGAQFWVLNKSEMVAGAATVDLVSFGPDPSLSSVHPVRSLSSTTTLYMVSTGTGNSASAVLLFAITGVPPGTVTVPPSQSLTFATPVNIAPNAPQKGTTALVDIQRSGVRVLSAAWFQGNLWFSLNDACTPPGDTTRSCIRLIQIDTTASAITQEIDFGIAGEYLFYPALSTDGFGSLGVIYGFSNSTTFPSLAVTGRVADDPPVTLATPLVIRNGTAPNTSGRYGDYFGASFDPSDQNLVWVAGEYGSTSGGLWATFLASMRVVAGFVITASPASLSFGAGTSATSTINLRSVSGLAGTVSLSTSVSPQGPVASLNPTSVQLTAGGNASSTLTVSSGASGNFTVTVTGTGGGFSHSANVAIRVVGFGISASRTIMTFKQGFSVTSTLTLTGVNGFTGTVGLTPTISPIVANGPTVSLSATAITLGSGGSGTSTLTVSSVRKTPTGLYNVTVTGTSGSQSLTLVFAVAVTPITFSINNLTTFTGVTVQTTGTLTLDVPSDTATVSGTVTVTATNSTTGASLFTKTYTITKLAMRRTSPVSFQTTLILNVQVSPYRLGSDLTLTLSAPSASSPGSSSVAVVISRNPDINGDGIVDMLDINIAVPSFGCSLGMACYDGRADLNADGTVNILDLSFLGAYFGTTDFIPNFSISASPTTLTIAKGSSGTTIITLASLQDFAGTVTLSATASNPGLSASFSPSSVTLKAGGTGTSTMTISVGASTLPGTYTVSATGTAVINGLTIVHSAPVAIIVPVPDFTISASPASLDIPVGSSGMSTITLTGINGFDGTITLSATVSNATLSNRPTASLNPTSVTLTIGGTGTSTLTISTASTTPLGSYTATVQSSSDSKAHSITVSFRVAVLPDFNITASPSTLVFNRGSSGTSTITLTSLNGFSDFVNLAATVSPGVANGPTASLKPAKLRLNAGGSGTSTLTISTTSSTPTGLYAVTVTGTSGSLSHRVTITLAVAPITFSIDNTSTFAGVTVQTTGTLSVDSPSTALTVSGTATVLATNSTTGAVLFTKTYTIAKYPLPTTSVSSASARFLLNIAVSPYRLSSDVTLNLSGSTTSTSVIVTRNIDVDGDGVVDMADLNIMKEAFGCSQGMSCYNPIADLNADGTVNILDFSLAGAYFGAKDFI